METNTGKPKPAQNPARTPALKDTTIWLVRVDRVDERARSFSIYRGERTVNALNETLTKARRSGSAHVELETSSCGPTAMTVADLWALGVLA